LQTTPVIEQYISIKANHQDSLLFFRMGDFYELFFDDAVLASDILNIVLTKRGKHKNKDIPMCGVPHHSAESYIKTLLEQGCKIALCEQMETPKEAKKRGYKSIVTRDVVRIITPGTLLEDTFLEQKKNNILMSLFFLKDCWSICWIDISTGLFQIADVLEFEINAVIEQLSPSEILIYEVDIKRMKDRNLLPLEIFTIFEKKASSKDLFLRVLGDVFSYPRLSGFNDCQLGAMTKIVGYLSENKSLSFEFYEPPEIVGISNFISMDPSTRKNLEINQSLEGNKKYSLLSVIDNTSCLLGSRLLNRKLNAPSTQISEILEWQSLVKKIFKNPNLNEKIRSSLKKYPDTERSISRIIRIGPNPRDLFSLCIGIGLFLQLKEVFEAQNTNELFKRKGELNKLENLYLELKSALNDEVPLNTKDGKYIKSGYDEELNNLRSLEKNSKNDLLQLQSKYIQITEIKSLKIKFNNVLGYFIEVPISNESKIKGQELFFHRQTTANTIRFKSLEVDEIEKNLLESSEKSIELEKRILASLCEKSLALYKDFMEISENIARLDVASSFAFTAKKYNWTCPKIDNGKSFFVKNARHSVIEKTLLEQGLKPFVPNDCFLDNENFLWLITGPNMAGKSTFLRQSAHIIILSQIGSFVPAEEAHIGIVNKLFSRIGASDNISKGQSTFMVEMLETANILRDADKKSFIILDEIGRGTSTFDGLSIAWATLESLISKNQSRTLFATHYHELTEIEKTNSRVSNVTCGIKEWNDEIIYSYKISKGKSQGSLGIKVAELAGFPEEVIKNAKQLLYKLEKGQDLNNKKPEKKLSNESDGENNLKRFREVLESVDPNAISPKEALDLLYKLKDII